MTTSKVPGLEGNGRDRYRANVVMMRTAFPDFRNPLDLIVADGDIAVSYGRMVGTNTGEMAGMAPTGKTIDVAAIGMGRCYRPRHVTWRALPGTARRTAVHRR